jgi:class 3 adenylate cyclase
LARLQKRRFSEPDEVRPVPNGQIEVVRLDDRVVGRVKYEPGWRWSKDVKPVAATASCQFHHFGITLSGRLRAQMQDGVELEIGPGEIFELPPGHDAWVVGDEPWVSVDFEAMSGYGRSTGDSWRRSVATIMLTDIVDSTGRAVAVGPSRWREILSRHNEIAERIIEGHEGRLVETTGDGVIAVFDGAERAVRAAAALTEAVRSLDIHIRAGVHTGEVDQAAGEVRGVAIHAAARISALAEPDSVLVSSTVRDLADGSSLEFEDHGLHHLKGLPGERRLFRYVSEAARSWRPAGER